MDSRDRELVLPQNTFAFVLDRTKGRVSVYVGPYKSSLSETDRLVIWDEYTGRFQIEDDLEDAIQTWVKAEEGQYVILSDPAEGDSRTHPPAGTITEANELAAGRKMIIPGPVSFPLWPGQVAQTIDGHHLKSNQYLLVRVYEPEQAQKHAESAVVAPQPGGEPEKVPHDAESSQSTFTMGQLIVIKGTDVSFYIPSTGIEVLPEDGNYVREAATLERLEYCILLDEDGEKRYLRGPDVVFPEPTEQFITDDNGDRKFRALELNEQSGLYIKVIAAHEEYTEGEELFITGKDTPIYFPRPEHTIISYGDRRKHHAIAIPKGEGRYVLDRHKGEVGLVRGPEMFLPDPRSQVIVRRILDPSTVAVMYPGNDEALAINEEMHKEKERKGAVSSSDYLVSSHAAITDVATSQSLRGVSSQFLGDQVTRGTYYTKPRTITLDTKYEGAVSINIWPGYAVLVTDKTGNRRVEVGPKAVLLEYDESLMRLSLSRGKPKTDDDLLHTVYLRTVNNQISDQVTVETKDLVAVTVELSYRVNFEEKDRAKWFDIENYVQLLTDNCRSRLRNAAKRSNINDFYTDSIDIIRNTLLGASEDGERPGLSFEENGMRLYDVEVVDTRIIDPAVGSLLSQATGNALAGAIELQQAEEATNREARLEDLRRIRIYEADITRRAESETKLAVLARELTEALKQADNGLRVARANKQEIDLERALARAEFEQNTDLQATLDRVELERLGAETRLFTQRMESLQGGVVEALQAFGDKTFVEQLVQAVGPLALATGVSTADILSQVFKDTPFEGIADTLTERPYRSHGNGGAIGIRTGEPN